MTVRQTLVHGIRSYRTARHLTVEGPVGLLHKFLTVTALLGLGLYFQYTGVWSVQREPMTAIALNSLGTGDNNQAMEQFYHATSGHPKDYPSVFPYCSNSSYSLDIPHANFKFEAPHCEPVDPPAAISLQSDGSSAFVATNWLDYVVTGFPCSNDTAAALCNGPDAKLLPVQGPQCECLRQISRFVVAAEKMPISFQFQYVAEDHEGLFGGVYPASTEEQRRIESSFVHKNGTVMSTFPGAIPHGTPVTASSTSKYMKFTFTFESILAMADVRLDDLNTGLRDDARARYRHTGLRAVVEINLSNRGARNHAHISRTVKATVRTRHLEAISRMVAGPIEHKYVSGVDLHGMGHAAVSPEAWKGYEGREYVRVDRVPYGVWIEFRGTGVVNVFNWTVCLEKMIVYLTATMALVTIACDLYVYRTMPFVRRERNNITSSEICRAQHAATLFTTSVLSKLARPGPRGGPDDRYQQLKAMCESMAGVEGMTPKAAFAISHAIVSREEHLEQKAMVAGYGKGAHGTPVQAPLFLELARCIVCATDLSLDRLSTLVEGADEHLTSDEYLRFRRDFEQARDRQQEGAQEKVAARGHRLEPNGEGDARNGAGSRAPRSRVSLRRCSDRSKSQQGERNEARSASYFMAALNPGANAAGEARQPATLSETRAPSSQQTGQRRRDYALTYAPREP